MFRNLRAVPRTLRGQITVIILLALVTVIATGRALENVAQNDYAIPNLESTATQVRTLALLLAQASPEERTSILTNAQRAGLRSRFNRYRWLTSSRPPRSSGLCRDIGRFSVSA